MRIAILGAGAMGCYFGGYLSLYNEVILIDSASAVVETINQKGIIVEETNQEIKSFKNVKAYLSGNFKEKVDLVIVLVKTCYTETTLLENKSLFQKGTIILTLQNGMGNQSIIESNVPSNIVITGTTTNNCVTLQPGKVRHSGQGVTTFGTEHHLDKTEWISKLFLECGLHNEISKEIKRLLWNKLFVNLSINCFTALFQAPIRFMVENPYAWECAKCVIHEAVLVANADGYEVKEEDVLNHIAKVMIEQGSGFSSMSQDCKNKRKMEIDSINGAVVRLAKLYTIPAPYNELMVNLIHGMEFAYEFHE